MTLDGAPRPAGGPAPQAVTQPVAAPLTGAAIFLVVTVAPEPDSDAAVRDLCSDLGGLLRAVGFRDLDGKLTCVMGFGAQMWDRLAGPGRPAGLHPFREIRAGGRHAVATPGDLLFHIRAERMDLCFELVTHIRSRLGDALDTVDEVHGFRYFDDRDLIGFVDGTENPTGQDAVEATVIGDEDPPYAGGSYVIVQKYLHDLAKWNALPTEEQEGIVGRTKLDVSRAVTGSLFFVPSLPLLESLADDPADADPGPAGTGPDQDGTHDDHAAGPAAPPGSAGSLGIGSLRGVTQHG